MSTKDPFDATQHPHVLCDQCQTAHDNRTFPFGCDAFAQEQTVRCGYGTHLCDGLKFVFQPDTFKDGRVCDPCLKKAVLAGRTMTVESYIGELDTKPSLVETLIDIFEEDLSQHERFVLRRNMPSLHG